MEYRYTDDKSRRVQPRALTSRVIAVHAAARHREGVLASDYYVLALLATETIRRARADADRDRLALAARASVSRGLVARLALCTRLAGEVVRGRFRLAIGRIKALDAELFQRDVARRGEHRQRGEEAQ
jgi:hypothetical protein